MLDGLRRAFVRLTLVPLLAALALVRCALSRIRSPLAPDRRAQSEPARAVARPMPAGRGRVGEVWLRALIRFAPRLAQRFGRLDRRALGELGEELAARHLRARGLAILGRRLRTRAGEVDLFARDGRREVVVEVKTTAAAPRASARWQPADRLSPAQRRRLAACARLLSRDAEPARLDLVECWLPPGEPARILHHCDLDGLAGGSGFVDPPPGAPSAGPDGS